MPMSPDFLDIVRALSDADARFIIVGAYAVNLYVDPRATGDLDIWVEPSTENAGKVVRALQDFGAPLTGVSESDFAEPGVTFQIGVAPLRIDILTEISGVGFDEAWNDRSMHPFGALTVPFLGKQTLIQNKRATARPKDLADLAYLEKE
jgi:hypothetical protein